jgi:hypothetical protein
MKAIIERTQEQKCALNTFLPMQANAQKEDRKKDNNTGMGNYD